MRYIITSLIDCSPGTLCKTFITLLYPTITRTHASPRSFYPLYPAPAGACLDLSQASQLQLPCTPDLLLLPSDLAPFAKVVQPGQQAGSLPEGQAQEGQAQQAPTQVVAVNPGRLARGAAAGTFAHVHVKGGEGALAQRCRVEIIRI